VYDTRLSIQQVLDALTEQPETIAALTKDLSRDRLHRPPRRGEWSLNDVLAHLRSCADMWGGYIEMIANEDHPTFRAVNPRTWIKSTNYPDLDFAISLRAFKRQRAELLRRLRDLSEPAWSRSATVTGGGAARERSVLDYARWLANHERSHLRQIATLAGSIRRIDIV
jgi:uncharacterized damage-inducible protein DinB